MPLGIIYMATCEITGKSYIGQTIRGLEERKQEHLCHSKTKKYHFYNAIRRYGFDSFKWEVLARVPIEQLDNLEIQLIKERDTIRNGYNHAIGGSVSMRGFKHSEDTKLKLSIYFAKSYKIITPDGFIETIRNLNKYCQSKSLSPKCMHRILKGSQKQHKGYRIEQCHL